MAAQGYQGSYTAPQGAGYGQPVAPQAPAAQQTGYGYQQSTAPAVAGVQQGAAYTGYSAYAGQTATQQPVAASTTYPGYNTAPTGTAPATSQPQPLLPATGYATPGYGVAPPTQPTGGYGAGAATGQYGVQQPAAPPQQPPPTGQPGYSQPAPPAAVPAPNYPTPPVMGSPFNQPPPGMPPPPAGMQPPPGPGFHPPSDFGGPPAHGGYGRDRDGYDRGRGGGFQGRGRGGPRGGGGFNSGPGGAEKRYRDDAVYITQLPDDVTDEKLGELFGSIGRIKHNRRTEKPHITLYTDKRTGKFKGEAMVVYEDTSAAKAAIEWFNDKQPLGDGKTIKVEFAIHMEPPGGYGGYRGGGGGGFRGGGGGGGFRGRGRGDFGGGGGGGGGGGRDRDRGGNQPGFTPAAGDWECPDPNCKNSNFARRTECNRCGAPRQDGGGGGGGGGYGGRGGGGGYRGRGGGGGFRGRGGGGGFRGGGGRGGPDRYRDQDRSGGRNRPY